MTKELNLKTPQDYIDIYKKMGCSKLMTEFFHIFDYTGGVMCRVIHLSRAYALESGIGSSNDPLYCKEHRYSHRLIADYRGIKELESYCPHDPKKKLNIHPRYFNDTKRGYRGSLVQYKGDEIWNDIRIARTIYFLQYLWKPITLNFSDSNDSKMTFGNVNSPKKDEYISHYIPFVELDAADVIKNKVLIGRLDMMNEDVFKDFSEIDKIVSKKFNEKFGKFFKHTSGNGMYYIGYPVLVNSIENLIKIKRGFLYNFCSDMTETIKEITNKVTIDAPWMPWNNYYKIPFSLHKFHDRISVPLNPEKELDYDFIKHFQNPLNINEDEANYLWKEAGYKDV